MPPDTDAQPLHNEPLPGFDGLYGLELLRADADEVRGRIAIDERHLQPFGIVHGGVYAAMAESMASTGTFNGNGGEKFVAGLSNVTNFLRPVFAGDTVTAVGVPRHRGRTTWVWEVEVRDGRDRPCALVRVTIAVREATGERALGGGSGAPKGGPGAAPGAGPGAG